jgi:hypothetical protein
MAFKGSTAIAHVSSEFCHLRSFICCDLRFSFDQLHQTIKIRLNLKPTHQHEHFFATMIAVKTTRIAAAFSMLMLASCSVKQDFTFTLVCKGKNDVMSKLKADPAETEIKEETRTYSFQLRDLEGYHCHTKRSEKIACIRSLDDEYIFRHESMVFTRATMSVTHTSSTEKKKTGMVVEESFEGQCVETDRPS